MRRQVQSGIRRELKIEVPGSVVENLDSITGAATTIDKWVTDIIEHRGQWIERLVHACDPDGRNSVLGGQRSDGAVGAAALRLESAASRDRAAMRWFAGLIVILILCGFVLVATWPLAAIMALGFGVCVFSALAVVIHVKNRQRSTLFQIVSAAALTSSSLATSLSATGSIAPWCWWLWLLMAMQATAGILVVHARLDARIASRGTPPASEGYRSSAQIALIVLTCTGIAAAILGRG